MQNAIENSMEKLRKEKSRIEREVKERVAGYITAALGLVIGLAWNEAIKSLIEFVFPLDKNTLVAKFLYAALLTLVVTILVFYLTRLLKKNGDDGDR